MKEYFVLSLPMKEDKQLKEEKRLFLCQNNIKKGDRVCAFNEPTFKSLLIEGIVEEVVSSNNTEAVSYRINGAYFSACLCTKVIGQISDEATWVVEGQKYSTYAWGDEDIVKLKGPCGHFH